MDLNAIQGKNSKCHISKSNKNVLRGNMKNIDHYDICLVSANKELESKTNYVLNKLRMTNITLNKNRYVFNWE